MPRVGRAAVGGIIYHVINRGNGRQKLFHKPSDYDAFIALLAAVQAVVPMRILAICLMPNHWHLVLWPYRDGDLSRFMLRLTTAHVRRHHAHYHNEGGGHLYQGRFKSFPTQDDHHLLVLMRYVESNAVRAGLVQDAARWRWCSFTMRQTSGPQARSSDAAARGTSTTMRRTPIGAAKPSRRTLAEAGRGAGKWPVLHEWPVERPRHWAELLRREMPAEQLEQVRTSIRRGRPLGSQAWVQRTAKALGLEFTLRPRGRPRKAEK